MITLIMNLILPFFQQKLVSRWQGNSFSGASLIHFHALVNAVFVLMEDACLCVLGSEKGASNLQTLIKNSSFKLSRFKIKTSRKEIMRRVLIIINYVLPASHSIRCYSSNQQPIHSL